GDFGCGGHRSNSCVAFRMWLGEMMRVQRSAVTDNFAKNSCAAFFSMLKRLKREDGGAFTERKTVTLGVEGAALGWRKRLKRIEARKNHMAERVESACQNAFALAAS